MDDIEQNIENGDVRFITVTSADLPLSCPMLNKTLWNKHPRIYLPIEKTGKAVCPYCETQYVLQQL